MNLKIGRRLENFWQYPISRNPSKLFPNLSGKGIDKFLCRMRGPFSVGPPYQNRGGVPPRVSLCVDVVVDVLDYYTSRHYYVYFRLHNLFCKVCLFKSIPYSRYSHVFRSPAKIRTDVQAGLWLLEGREMLFCDVVNSLERWRGIQCSGSVNK